jgi:acetoin utilization protein AcuC
MTTASLEYCARWFRDSGLPWVALGGGGYNKVNVARGWALIWGAILGIELPDFLPPRFVQTISALGFSDQRLRDLPHHPLDDDYRRAKEALEERLEFLRRNFLPLHGIVP